MTPHAMTGPPQRGGRLAPLTVYLPPELALRLQALASADGRSLSAYVGRLIARALTARREPGKETDR